MHISVKIVGIVLGSVSSSIILADTIQPSQSTTNDGLNISYCEADYATSSINSIYATSYSSKLNAVNTASHSSCCGAHIASTIIDPTNVAIYGINSNTANFDVNNSSSANVTNNTATATSDNFQSCNKFGISLYQPTYILPFYHSMSPLNAAGTVPDSQHLDQNEVRYQISFKVPLWENLFNQSNVLYAAYTQDSFWQLYNNSPFFSETNYEPEVFLDNQLYKNLGDGWEFSDLDMGVVHQSNGRGGEFERSWNRAYLDAIFNHNNWMISIKPWTTIFDAESSDLHNPDISHYMGYGEEMLAYQYDRNTFSLTLRNDFESGFRRGAEWATWSYPLLHRNIKGFIFLFSGFGENLIEYNHYTNAAGIGVTLNDVDDLSSVFTNPFEADASNNVTATTPSALPESNAVLDPGTSANTSEDATATTENNANSSVDASNNIVTPSNAIINPNNIAQSNATISLNYNSHYNTATYSNVTYSNAPSSSVVSQNKNDIDNTNLVTHSANNPNNGALCDQFGISLYQPTYILPFYHSTSPFNDGQQIPDSQKLDQNQVKYQYSFKVPIWINLFNQSNVLYAAYTQDSFWQLYNNSPFFSETDYEPEIFLDNQLYKNLGDGWQLSDVDIGVVHQSNGRGGDYERSWNRAYLDGVFHNGNWMVSIKPWITIFNAQSIDEHNRDITRYLGDGQEILAYQYGKNTLSLTLENDFESGFKRGAETATWSFPLLHHNVKGYVYLFSGFGESLIAYNHYTNGAGLGITLNDWE